MNIDHLLLDLATTSDRALLHRVASFAREQRRLNVYLVAALAEVETRGLHLGAGFPGLWEYCRSLGLSEGEAWRRIQAARLVRKFPKVLESLAAGRLHLSGVSSLAKVMTSENASTLLDRVAGMTKREIEAVVAELLVPDVSPQIAMDFGEPSSIALSLPGGNDDELTPDATPKRYAPEPSRPPVTSTRALSPRVRAAFEAYSAMVDQTGDAGNVDDLLVRALETATAVEEKRRFGAKAKPAKSEAATPGRSPVPKPVRHEVYDRDEGRCTFTSPDGVRCNTRHRLQLHHIVPVAHGGLNTPDNLTIHCGPMTGTKRSSTDCRFPPGRETRRHFFHLGHCREHDGTKGRRGRCRRAVSPHARTTDLRRGSGPGPGRAAGYSD